MRRPKITAWIAAGVALLMVVAAGCGSSQPTQQTQPAPAAQPQAGQPAPAKAEAPKPAEAKKGMKLVIAYPSIPDITDAPSLLAWDELNKQGYDVIPKFMAKSELTVEAVMRGDAQLATTSFPYLPARLKGAPIKGFLQQIGVEWTMVGRGKVKTLKDLHGARLAQHSAGSLGKNMTYAVLKRKAPDVKPNVMYVPGSENRADALIKGSIDATPVELVDLINLQAKLKDLNVILSFTEELPDLMANVYFATEDFMKKNPEVIKDVIKALVLSYRKVYDDPNWLIERAPKVYPSVNQDTLPKVVELYRKYKVYPINGGLTATGQKFTVDFFTESGQLDKGLTPEMAYDRTLLDQVLKDIGTK